MVKTTNCIYNSNPNSDPNINPRIGLSVRGKSSMILATGKEQGVNGTQQKHSLSKAVVKHDRAQSAYEK